MRIFPPYTRLRSVKMDILTILRRGAWSAEFVSCYIVPTDYQCLTIYIYVYIDGDGFEIFSGRFCHEIFDKCIVASVNLAGFIRME